MSRVEAGELRPNLAVFALADLVGEAVARSGLRAGDREVTVSRSPRTSRRSSSTRS